MAMIIPKRRKKAQSTISCKYCSTKTENAGSIGFPANRHGMRNSCWLKKPKTKSSVRKIYLPRSLAKELDQYCAKRHTVLKENGYPDYGMVFFLDNGRPISGDVIVKRFKAFIKENNLRPVD